MTHEMARVVAVEQLYRAYDQGDCRIKSSEIKWRANENNGQEEIKDL
jgi:hypothetical protein